MLMSNVATRTGETPAERSTGPAAGPVARVAPAAACVHGLWRYLRMHGASAHEADDLVQEAFLIAVQKGALGFDPPATAVFLRRTARFLFLRLRRGGREAEQLADAVDSLWQRDCAADDGDRMLGLLRACLGELTERARRAVERAYGLGDGDPSSRLELASELGLAPDGVKTLMQRARQQLRACIERRQS